MSKNQHWRESWIQVIYARAVALFHKSRKKQFNANLPLSDLARQCANTVFTEAADTIIGDREVCAKEFMAYCRENFIHEIRRALAELPEEENAERVA